MITNNVTQAFAVTYPWITWDLAFTQEELDWICNYFETKTCQKAQVATRAQVEEHSARNTQIYFEYPSTESQWIFDKFNYFIDVINKTYYNFDLIGYSAIQYGEYHANSNGHYDWHMDLVTGDKNEQQLLLTRKLSIVMLLNDNFEGGQLQLSEGNQSTCFDTVPQSAGNIIAFPSWMMHRVCAVTKGVRKSLVIWTVGPKFK